MEDAVSHSKQLRGAHLCHCSVRFHNGVDGVPAHQEMGDVEEVLKRGLGRSPVGHIVPRHALRQRKVEIVFIVVVQSIVSSRSGPHGGHVLQTVELGRKYEVDE